MPLTEITKARRCGHIGFHRIYEYPVDLSRILRMCYLKPEPEGLLKIGRDEAIRGLVCWLHRDTAYQTELMSLERAQKMESFIREYADKTSRFFTNGNWHNVDEPRTWHPLTESIFDGGVLIEGGRGNYTEHTRLWFEDED